jgi:hypothetical protein
MMRTLFVVFVALATVGALSADSLSTTGAAALLSVPNPFAPLTGASGVQGNPFWNNFSTDGANMNVGYYLTGSGGAAGFTTNYIGHAASSVYLASAAPPPNENPQTNFNFVREASLINVSVLYTNAGFNQNRPGVGPGTEIGIYDVSNPASRIVLFAAGSLFNPGVGTGGVYNLNLAATPSASDVGTFASYGFYATVCPTAATCQTYFTNSSLNTINAGVQRFALFQSTTNALTFYLAFDDGDVLGAEAFGDFNDIIIRITTATPEPVSLALVGFGLLAGGLVRRYRRRNR